MHRLPTQGQLWRLCTVSQRQVAPDMQAATMREVDRKEGEWEALCSLILQAEKTTVNVILLDNN